MKKNIPNNPKKICIVRLSALGDVVLAIPAVKAIRKHFPNAEITWIIEKKFLPAVDEIDDITFFPIDKPNTLSDYYRLWKRVRTKHYDVLLAMQASFRANLIYPLITSETKIGFDSRRAKDLHKLFITHPIPKEDHHLLDGFMSFAKVLGIPHGEAVWNPIVDTEDILWVKQKVGQTVYVIINVATSKKERNWPITKYIELIKTISNTFDYKIVLTGGNSKIELETAEFICQENPGVVNLAGRTSIKKLMALLKQSVALISPDSGPVHIARAFNTPVLGLYAIARPELSGPYQKLEFTVNKYNEAVKEISNKAPRSVDWHYRVHSQAAMDLISVNDVIAKFEMIKSLTSESE